MNHDNRGRLTVDLGGNWRLYATHLPATGKALGLVTNCGMTGALVFIERTGIYVRVNVGAAVSLPQIKVQAAIASANSKAKSAVYCQRCGHPPGSGWLDDGETCPKCKLVQ